MAKLKVKVSGKVGVFETSPKNKSTALVLCILFGGAGFHYFYVGRIGRGVLALLTANFLGIGWIVDIVTVARGKFTDKDGMYLRV